MKSRARFKAFAPPILDLTPPASDPVRRVSPPMTSAPAATAAPALFVQAVDLPIAALKDARAAVALQLDRLSPLPPGEGVAAVALVGPAEANLTRYAVAIAPLSIFTPVPGGRALKRVWSDGTLEGETYRFRFDHPDTAAGAEGVRGHLQVVAISALCLILILGGASIGLQQRLVDDQDQLERARSGVIAARRQAQARSAAARRWAQLGETNQAGRVGCVFDRLAASGSGRAYLAAVSITPSLITADFSTPPGQDRLPALAVLGLAPSAPTTDPVAAAPLMPLAGPQPGPAPAYGVPGSFQATPGYPRRGPPPPRSAPGQGGFYPGVVYGPTPDAGGAFVAQASSAGMAPPSAPETLTLTLARWACP